MPKKYVEAFFKDGSIRLSSFHQFSKHKDEQRHDSSEGWNITFGSGKSESMFVVQGHGNDCYVLCGSLHDTKEIQSKFPDADGCFVIDNILGFADSISYHIPNFISGFEGHAIYQDEKIIEKDIGIFLTEEKMENCILPDGNIDKTMLPALNLFGTVEELFIKPSKYASQSEYRLFWQVNAKVEDYLDIKAPNARQFCRRIR